jgi:hypothetical protein
VKGPFKGTGKNLNYTGPRELLGEKFHIAPELLTKLNPKASFEAPGAQWDADDPFRRREPHLCSGLTLRRSANAVHAEHEGGLPVSSVGVCCPAAGALSARKLRMAAAPAMEVAPAEPGQAPISARAFAAAPPRRHAREP